MNFQFGLWIIDLKQGGKGGALINTPRFLSFGAVCSYCNL